MESSYRRVCGKRRGKGLSVLTLGGGVGGGGRGGVVWEEGEGGGGVREELVSRGESQREQGAMTSEGGWCVRVHRGDTSVDGERRVCLPEEEAAARASARALMRTSSSKVAIRAISAAFSAVKASIVLS